jgi:hypothetical protein
MMADGAGSLQQMSAKKDKADAVSTKGRSSGTQDIEECFIIMPISDTGGYKPEHFRAR